MIFSVVVALAVAARATTTLKIIRVAAGSTKKRELRLISLRERFDHLIYQTLYRPFWIG